ncbi:SDR family oxidoreductase [Limnohabitans sp.]|uniref:SDR family oxidoreductase n=1 Tax=Limnohabitans sp. TaxID=1907725 RepID=UPI00391D9959
MDLGIAGKWALVGGASKGLGWGCARALALEGVHVVMVARGEQALQASVARLRAEVGDKVQVLGVPTDITTAEGRQAIWDATHAPGKDYDIVVTNAGGPPAGDFREWTRETWVQALDANMLTPIELIKSTVDGMAARGFGRIVNITSAAVKAPYESLGLSNGARAGLTGFVAGLARQPRLASCNVTINNLLPGPFDTDRLRSNTTAVAERAGQTFEALWEQRRLSNPTRRFGDPAEFGAACAFLCSVHAGYMTGQNVMLDGGAYPGTF